MNKRFERYFGNNIARKIYIAGIVLIGIGIIVAYAYWAGYGVPIAALGVIAFFATSSFQVSDKDVDGQVESSTNSFLENEVDGKSVGRDTLKAEDFSVFNGYICDSGTRFKSGSDGKIRTSRYFVTAVSVKDKYCVIATSLFDLISSEEASTSIFTTKNADTVGIDVTPTEFPKGNRKCVLSVTRGDTEEVAEFYLPDDALADQLIAKFK